jgi:hypothetical protein
VFAFFEEVGKVFENALGGLDVRGVTVNGNVLSTRVDSYVKQRFEVLDVPGEAVRSLSFARD